MKPHAWTISAAEHGQPLVRALADQLQVSRAKAKALLDARTVFVNRRRVWMARHPVHKGDRVEVQAAPGAPPTASGLGAAILWEDDHLLVLDKPPGITATGKTGLESRLRKQRSDPAWQAVHRLDRDTTGCLMFTRNDAWREQLVEQFRARAVRKEYRAVVRGRVAPRHQTLRTPLDDKTAITHLTVVRSSPQASELAVRIETGRTHQIRRHLEAAGHPVIGDRTYGATRRQDASLRQVPRHLLHAQRLQFTHPARDERISVTAPLPQDFQHWAGVLVGKAGRRR